MKETKLCSLDYLAVYNIFFKWPNWDLLYNNSSQLSIFEQSRCDIFAATWTNAPCQPSSEICLVLFWRFTDTERHWDLLRNWFSTLTQREVVQPQLLRAWLSFRLNQAHLMINGADNPPSSLHYSRAERYDLKMSTKTTLKDQQKWLIRSVVTHLEPWDLLQYFSWKHRICPF